MTEFDDPATVAEVLSDLAPGFASLFEPYLNAVYSTAATDDSVLGRKELVESIASAVADRNVTDVLDCAAGTGFPGLELAAAPPVDGLELHLCDADPAMIQSLIDRGHVEFGFDHDDLARLAPPRKTAFETVDATLAERFVLDWSDLDELKQQYDYVMCRGNSLVYATTWSGGVDIASPDDVRAYLTTIADRVRPGGYLHVDAPRRLVPACFAHPPEQVGDATVTIKESIEPEATGRKWRIYIDVERADGSRRFTFERYSTRLTIDDIGHYLEELGFEETESVELDGERSGFGVIIARKPR